MPRLHHPHLRQHGASESAAAASAHLSRSRQAHHHQYPRVRRLRRLRREIELRLRAAARHALRPQAHTSTSRAATRTFPASKVFCPRSSACMAERRASAQRSRRCVGLPPPIFRSLTACADAGHLRHSRDRRRRHGRRHDRRDPRMAAHIECKGCGMIDMAGLAQKGGAVYSHVKLAAKPEDIHAIRVAADKRISCSAAISLCPVQRSARRHPQGRDGNRRQHGRIYPGDFTRNADYSLPASASAGRSASGQPSRRFRRRDGNRHGAARHFHRRQHVHARRGLSARACAARRRLHRTRDRTEWRSGAHEHRPFRLGGAGRTNRPLSKRCCRRASAKRRKKRRLRQSSRATLPSSRPIRTRPTPRATGPPSKPSRQRSAARPGRSGLAIAAARYLFKLWRSRRIRGRAALYGRRIRAPARRDLSKATSSSSSTSPRPYSAAATLPASVKTTFGPWMLKAFRPPRRYARPARRAVRTSSDTQRSAAGNARCLPITRHASGDCRTLTPENHALPSRSPAAGEDPRLRACETAQHGRGSARGSKPAGPLHARPPPLGLAAE